MSYCTADDGHLVSLLPHDREDGDLHFLRGGFPERSEEGRRSHTENIIRLQNLLKYFSVRDIGIMGPGQLIDLVMVARSES